MQAAGDRVAIAGFELDLSLSLLKDAAGTEVALRPQAMEVLKYLVRHAGRIATKDELMQSVWAGTVVGDDSLVQCIREIRLTLNDTDHRLIRTAHKRGYWLALDEARAADASTRPAVEIAVSAGASSVDDAAEPRGGNAGGVTPTPAVVSAAIAGPGVTAVAAVTAIASASTRAARRRFGAGAAALAIGSVAGVLGAAWWWRSSAVAAGKTGPGQTSIVVLPIRNLSGGERWDRLTRGLTEDITTALARNHWLFVIAAKTAYAQAAGGKDARLIAQELGVRFALEGSLQVEGEQLRVNSMLIEAPAGRTVWSQRWDKPIGAMFEIQDSIVSEIDNALGSVWNGAISALYRSRAKRHTTDNLNAYELYLLGSEVFQRFEPTSAIDSQSYFERAVQLDPGFAKAWGKLCLVQAFFFSNAKNDEERSRALAARRHAARQAHQADSDDPYALLQMSWVYSLDGDGDSSEKATRRAAAFAPNNADLLAEAAWAGSRRNPLGATAVEWAQHALRLNPNPPAWYHTSLGLSAFYAGRYDLAVEALSKGPPIGLRFQHVAAAQAYLGNVDAAREAAQRVLVMKPGFSARALLQDRGEYGNAQSRDRFLKGMLLAGLPE
jgi:TolB-like protein/DNA-binding winged helix-turn-helix (wHTH) protein/tetratricopeptide (TPR) repeat protein